MANEDIILESLRERSDIRVVSTSVTDSDGRGYDLQVSVCGKSLDIRMEPLDLYPPLFYLKTSIKTDLIPHILKGGLICYMRSEGLLLNQDDPQGVIDYCLNRLICTLEDGFSGRNRDDLIDEFEVGWSEVAKYKCGSFVELSPEPKKIILVVDETLGFMAGDSENEVFEAIKRFAGRYPSPGVKKARGLYIPLETPIFPKLPRTLDELRSLIRDHLSKSNWELLKKVSSDMYVTEFSPEFVLLCVPTPNGSEALAGIVLSKFRLKSGRPVAKADGTRLFIDGGLNAVVEAVLVERLDYRHLLLRTSGETFLRDKHVLVIGCGSVGGFVAMELARAGVTRFTLVDQDVLSVANIHRHVLGARFLGEAKVTGLKKEIEEKCPFAKVADVRLTIEQFIKRRISEDIDLVLVALGNPTLEIYLNRLLKKSGIPSCVVYTWVEPYGIGGHALLVNADAPGCVECLYQDTESEILHNRASLADKGQYFGKTIAGCGSAFTPYGNLDAIQTAVLASRLSIDALLGREVRNSIRSWKGNTQTFEELGYRLSKRMELTESQLFEQRYSYKVDECPVCGLKCSN